MPGYRQALGSNADFLYLTWENTRFFKKSLVKQIVYDSGASWMSVVYRVRSGWLFQPRKYESAKLLGEGRDDREQRCYNASLLLNCINRLRKVLRHKASQLASLAETREVDFWSLLYWKKFSCLATSLVFLEQRLILFLLSGRWCCSERCSQSWNSWLVSCEVLGS